MALKRLKKARGTTAKIRMGKRAKKATRPKAKKIKKVVKRKMGSSHYIRRKVTEFAGTHGPGDGEED